MGKNLTANLWIQAGFRALVHSGPQSLKAEPLAKELGVSKGSFYWHFKDIADFKSKMIQHWQKIATEDIIANIEDGTTHPIHGLENLVQAATQLPPANFGGAGSESAIRDWARSDQNLAIVVAEIDRARVSFTKSLFRKSGQPKELAEQSANLLYSALIGLEILHQAGQTDPTKNLAALLKLLLKQTVER